MIIHGNVKTLFQDHQEVKTSSQKLKRIDYTYDLISGNVKLVAYQNGEADQWLHRYDYDADNRITEVYTSKDSIIWDQDASYLYYDHGPLARIELGDNQVQGIDYAYTLQGWIKGVNSDLLKPQNDMGLDDAVGSTNRFFARDAAGFSLGYYDGDYSAIDQGGRWGTQQTNFLAKASGSQMLASRNDLYNGNISWMNTNIKQPDVSADPFGPQATVYQYDQLNRLVSAEAYQNLNTTNDWATSGGTTNYRNTFTYDANGNILNQYREDQNQGVIDSLTYHYLTDSQGRRTQNRLYHVTDNVSPLAYSDDINGDVAFDAVDIIAGNNYTYTALGELASDREEGIDTILWRPDGKIRKIIYEASTGKDNLEFQYDAMGNRIAKLIKDGSDSLIKATYYVRDAQGNVMTVYQWQLNDTLPEHIAAERYIYGSSRLGVETTPVEMIGAVPQTQDTAVRFLQYKHYEISNHLGNVLAVVSDKKVLKDTNSDFVVDEYHPDIVSANDYSPFGVYLYGRTWSAGGYRYGFNGMEKDDEVKGSGNHLDFGARVFDPRLGRFLSVDQMASKMPSESPYNFAGNNPIFYVDLNGNFKWPTGQAGEDLAKRYPTAYKYLGDPNNVNKSILELTSSKEVMSAILDNIGGNLAKQGWHIPSQWKGSNYELSADELKDAFTPGRGPELKITMNPGASSILEGSTADAGGYNPSNRGKEYPYPMELNEGMLQDLENAQTDEDRQAALTIIVAVTINEYVENFGPDSFETSKFQNGEYQSKNFGAAETTNRLYPGIRYDKGNLEDAKDFIKNNSDKSTIPNVPSK